MGLVESEGEVVEEVTSTALEDSIYMRVPCPGYPSHRIRYNPETRNRMCVRCELTDHVNPTGVVRRAKGTPANTSKRRRIADRDGFSGCRYCGYAPTSLLSLTLEHLDSQHAGGDSDIDNLGLSCGPCNNLKGAMTETEFMAWLSLGVVPKRIPMDAQLGLHRQEAKRRTTGAGFAELLEMLRAEGCPLHAHLHSPAGIPVVYQ